jgi:hypothetical protein
MAAPSAKRVAQRSLVLSAIAMRAYLENEGAKDTSDYHQRMLRWLGQSAQRTAAKQRPHQETKRSA